MSPGGREGWVIYDLVTSSSSRESRGSAQVPWTQGTQVPTLPGRVPLCPLHTPASMSLGGGVSAQGADGATSLGRSTPSEQSGGTTELGQQRVPVWRERERERESVCVCVRVWHPHRGSAGQWIQTQARLLWFTDH